jgi:hypothetical protein
MIPVPPSTLLASYYTTLVLVMSMFTAEARKRGLME